MIIHFPQKAKNSGRLQLSARIELRSLNIPYPKTLWYSFPGEYEPHIALRGDPFLAATIIPAMVLGEDIEIDAPVSPRLAGGLMEFQKLLMIWFPKQLQFIQIRCANMESFTPGKSERETASLFSGGVDSSFILNANLPPQQPIKQLQIRHALFVHGADIPLTASERFDSLADLSRKSLGMVGVNLIPCATNVRSFTEGLFKWDYSHGAALISTGLVLSGLLERLYIASSFNYRSLVPWGSSPLLDHWLSTETLEILHVGTSYRRTEKMKVVGNWKPAQGYLRVCSTTENIRTVNCERCDKCLSTKAILEMEGTLARVETFTRPFRYNDYFRWALICSPHTNIPPIVLRQAIVDRRWKVIPFAILVNLSRFMRFWMDRCMPAWLRDYLRNRYFPLEKNPFFSKNLPDV